LPFGRGRKWMNNSGWATAVLGGWVLTGIHQYSSGIPIALSANNGLPLFTGILRPDVVTDTPRRVEVEKFDPNVDRWINPAAFRVPGALRFGTAARSYADLRNPAYLNENFGLLKKFRFAERLMVTFRAEWFNALNRTIFAAPQSNVSNAQFGRITSQAFTPRQGQVALRLDF